MTSSLFLPTDYLTTGDKFMQEKLLYYYVIFLYGLQRPGKRLAEQGVVTCQQFHNLFSDISARVLLNLRVQLV